MLRPAIIILLASLVNFTLTAQSSWRYSFQAGILGCGRILSYKGTNLNPTEKNELQTLEVIKPGYVGSIGVEKEIKPKTHFGLSIGYQYSGFGSKTFTVPDTVQNNTPQFELAKESYIIHRVFLSAALSKMVYQREKFSFFVSVGSALFFNPRFVRRTYSINKDGTTGFISTTVKPLPEFPQLDISIQVGVGYEKKIGKYAALSITPNIYYFVRPYTTRGDIVLYDYLFLKKKTTGHLYTFGLEVRFIKAIEH